MARDDPESYRKTQSSHRDGPFRHVVIYVKDHGTSGPIARAVKVAHELMARSADVTLMLRDEVADSKMLGDDLKVVAYDTRESWLPSRSSARQQIKRLKPDVLVVDEYPFVNQMHAQEWERVIDSARKANSSVHVCGLTCDIPIYPKDVEAPNVSARAQRVDQILVTGDPQIIDFDQYVEEGAAADSVATKRSYVGFMDEARKGSIAPSTTNNDIVVYLGGHNMDHQAQYVSLLANIPYMNDALRNAHWHIIMPAIQHMTTNAKVDAILNRLPEDIQKNISIEEAGSEAEFTAKLRNTDMAIVGGGQTANKTVLVEGLPTVIVPTRNGEQRHRALHFSKAMPERVAAMLIPSAPLKPMTRDRIIREQYYGNDRRDWVDKTLDWAATAPEAAEMRDTIAHVYEQRGKPQPNTTIMLDGAKRIAGEIFGACNKDGTAPAR